MDTVATPTPPRRPKLTATETTKEMILKMGEGNPGALRVLLDLLQKGQVPAFNAMLDLDDMNIRGTQIWVAYKDFAGENLDAFQAATRSRSATMVTVVNRECLKCSGYVAVTSGASFKR